MHHNHKFHCLDEDLIEFLHSIDNLMGLKSENIVNLQVFNSSLHFQRVS